MLTGYFDARLFAVLFVAAEAGVLLAAIFSGFLGSENPHWGAHAQWAGITARIEYRPGMIALKVLALGILAAYPVAVGIGYFSLSPEHLTLHVFQYTLCLVVLGNYPFLILPVTISSLLCANLDDETRTRFVTGQLTSLVPNALWMSLLFWTFGIPGTGRPVGIGGISIAFSPLLLALLIVFFSLTIFIPYLIGSQRAKKRKTALLERRQALVKELEELLTAPAASLYLPGLIALQGKIDMEIEELAGHDPMVAIGMRIDYGDIDAELLPIADAYRAARDLDPRFQHIDALRQLSTRIATAREDLAQKTSDGDLQKAAATWAVFHRQSSEDLSKEISETKATRTPTTLILMGIFMPVWNVGLSELAKSLSDYVLKTVVQ